MNQYKDRIEYNRIIEDEPDSCKDTRGILKPYIKETEKPMTKEEKLAMIEALKKIVDDLNPYIRTIPKLSVVRDNLWEAQMSLRVAINRAEINWC
jgi:hypothetical protein